MKKGAGRAGAVFVIPGAREGNGRESSYRQEYAGSAYEVAE
jgi:hypothetical protein